MAGGVALNCVANGRVLREVPFEDIWIQPAAGDAGGALGIALAIWHRYLGKPRLSPEKQPGPGNRAWHGRPATCDQNHAQDARATSLAAYADGMKGSYLGPRDTAEAEIEDVSASRGKLPYQKYSREELPRGSCRAAGRRKNHRTASGTNGVWPTRARRSQHYRRPAFAREMQSVMNLKIKVSRELSSVCAERAARARGRLV